MSLEDFDPGPLAEVSAQPADEPADDNWTLMFVRQLPHPPERVWDALTDPTQLVAWAPFGADRDLGSTGPATLVMVDGESVDESEASVTVADPPTLLEYTWGTDLLRWELEPTERGTRLTLHHTVRNQDWLPRVAAGWHLCLVVADHLLDGRPIEPITGARSRDFGWEALHDAYAEHLGITGTGWPDEL